jgi:hypothetical protein
MGDMREQITDLHQETANPIKQEYAEQNISCLSHQGVTPCSCNSLA